MQERSTNKYTRLLQIAKISANFWNPRKPQPEEGRPTKTAIYMQLRRSRVAIYAVSEYARILRGKYFEKQDPLA